MATVTLDASGSLSEGVNSVDSLHKRIDGALTCCGVNRRLGSLIYGQLKLAILLPTGNIIDVGDGLVDVDDVADGESSVVVLVGDEVVSSTNVMAAAVGVLVGKSVQFHVRFLLSTTYGLVVATGVVLLLEARIFPTTAAMIKHTMTPTVMDVKSLITTGLLVNDRFSPLIFFVRDPFLDRCRNGSAYLSPCDGE